MVVSSVFLENFLLQEMNYYIHIEHTDIFCYLYRTRNIKQPQIGIIFNNLYILIKVEDISHFTEETEEISLVSSVAPLLDISPKYPPS